jgi:hypothetical protein
MAQSDSVLAPYIAPRDESAQQLFKAVVRLGILDCSKPKQLLRLKL